MRTILLLVCLVFLVTNHRHLVRLEDELQRTNGSLQAISQTSFDACKDYLKTGVQFSGDKIEKTAP